MENKEILEALLRYQETTRRAIESLSSELASNAVTSKEVSILTLKVDNLEKIVHEFIKECKECRGALQSKINGLTEKFYDEQKISLREQGALLEKARESDQKLSEKLQELERQSAEQGGRYGAIFGIASVLLIEFIRWVISKSGR
jgi:hypothetical protein